MRLMCGYEMKKVVGWVVAVLLGMVVGCSGQTEQGEADVGKQPPRFEAMISMVLSDGVERYCEYVESLEDVNQFSCVLPETGKIYLCAREIDPNGEPFFYCEAAKEGET